MTDKTKNKRSAGQEFNLDRYERTGKMVVPLADIEFYKDQIGSGFKLEKVTHPQFLDYIKFVKDEKGIKIMNSKEIANEILKQLGGNRFIAMTGARNFYCDDNSLHFRLPSTITKDRINYVKIILNSMDTYDLEFVSIRGEKMKTVATFEGAYNDMLQSVVSDKTGLCLTL